MTPYFHGYTFVCTGAGILGIVYAGYRGQIAFQQPQYFAYSIFLRLFGKHIAALGTAGAFDKSGAAQLGNDLFQIFVGNILPLGDIFNGDEAAGMIVSQIKHQPQSITSFGRDFHKHTSFQKLDIILLLVY